MRPLTVVDLRHDSVKRTSTMTLAAPSVERFCVLGVELLERRKC